MDIEKFVKQLLSDARVQGAVVQIMEAVMDLLGNATKESEPEIQEVHPAAVAAPELVVAEAVELELAPASEPASVAEPEPVPAPVAETTPVTAPAPIQKKRTRQITDFSALPEANLRTLYYNRRKCGKEIEPELNAELTRRFPTYDAKAQIFGATPKKTDFTKSSDDSLRAMYNTRQKKGKEIEPELNAELARRFPTYDAKAKRFGVTPQKTDLTQSSDDSLRTMHKRRQKLGKEIEPELNAELARRFPTYDATTQKFIGHKDRTLWSHHATRRESDFSSLKDSSLRTAYNNRVKNGLPIEPELQAELVRRFPTYDAETQKFTGHKKKVDTPALQPTEPTPVPEVVAPAPKKEKVIPTIVKGVKRPAPQPGELHVTLKEVKLTLRDVYNNVIVNGRTILKNHVNTKVRTLLGGTLLAIHGIATERSDLPKKPLWLVFNTRLEENRFVSRDKCSGYNTYITALHETQSRVHAECNNRATVLLERDKYERIAAGSRFILVDEKTK